MKPEVVVVADAAALAEEAARGFVAAAGKAVAAQGRFSVTLAGGSTPANLYCRLAQPPYRDQVDWGRTWVYFGDERCVPPDHPHSNYRMAREALLDHVPLPPTQIERIRGEWPAHLAAQGYQIALRASFHLAGPALPRFDLILLGVGADGHTASLFPGQAALASHSLVAATDAPFYADPPVARITLTLRAINAAATVLFLASGGSKAGAVWAALAGPEPADPLPARLVQPRTGRLVWLLDQAAAARLKVA